MFDEPVNISRQILDLYSEIFSMLELELREVEFAGPVGIDAFIYRTADDVRRMKPIVEINPRYTMGRLTLELMKHACPGSCGLFRIVSMAQARAEGFADLNSYSRGLIDRFPLRLEGQPVSRLKEGALFLNDPAQAQACLATFQVNRTPAALLLPQ